MSDIKKNLERITGEISRYAVSAGRGENEVTLMAVTKNHPFSAVREAVDFGIRCFGENRVQEAGQKYGGDNRYPGNLHLIGHLQSNKTRKAAELFDWVDSIDSIKLLRKLEHAASLAGKSIEILFELNISGEQSKSGFPNEDELYKALEVTRKECRFLKPRGLMSIGPLTEDRGKIRKAFSDLNTLFGRVQGDYPDFTIDTLSMGMSGDWKIAVEEGSTMVRIGTAIFGSRGY